jgi:hypothetical protein
MAKGKKGRKIGKGDHKAKHSKWGSYAAIFIHGQSKRLERMAKWHCKACSTQFHSIGAFKRHDCK